MQVEGRKVGGGQHRDDAGQSLGRIGVDRLDAGMGIGRADEIAEQHAGQLDVIDIVALALGEADVLNALAAGTHAFQVGDTFFAGGGQVVHSAASLVFISFAADMIALTMFWYPVQRHRLPAMPKRTSSSVGDGFSCSRRWARVIMPGVQKPHCSPWCSRNMRCSTCRPSGLPKPSMVVMVAPSACAARTVQDLTDFPSISTVHAPQWLVSQPMWGPRSEEHTSE